MSKEKNKFKKDEREQGKLAACEEQLQQWKEKFARVSADLENFKRRMEKERLRWMKHAQTQLIKDFLVVLDDFERVGQQKEQKELSPEVKKLFAGFLIIGSSLDKVLKKAGLSEIDQMKNFDPNLHEALVQVESDDHKPGEIVQVLQKGYMFNDELLRPAKVSVAK